jgi:3,4-dihydroxyphenylacetate 2,3-dioxygenase
MGEVVAAIFTTHVPRLTIKDPAARKAYMGDNVSTFYDAMERLERERLRGLDFDTFVLFDAHWFTTLDYVINAHQRLSGIYTSEELPEMLHEMPYDYAGDPELARAIETAARARAMHALASAYSNLPIHYPTLTVMSYFNPAQKPRRVVSIGVCQTASVENDLNFGGAVGDAIRTCDRRVVLVASGGLSHKFWDYDHAREHASASPDDISVPENRAWDERVMDWFRSGSHNEVIAHASEFRARCSPEARFSHYLMMAGAMGGTRWTWRGEQFGRYEAALGTGQAIFFFARPPDDAARTRSAGSVS